MAMAWTDVNTAYYDMIEGDPKLQGNYTPDGKLLLGWICEQTYPKKGVRIGFKGEKTVAYHTFATMSIKSSPLVPPSFLYMRT